MKDGIEIGENVAQLAAVGMLLWFTKWLVQETISFVKDANRVEETETLQQLTQTKTESIARLVIRG